MLITNNQDISEKLKTVIEEQKHKSFCRPKETEDTTALGVVVARFFKWNADDIMKVVYSALQDSNQEGLIAKIQTAVE